LPVWLQNLSPFSHAPTVPATDLAVGTLAGLLVVFAVVGAIGLAVIRRRDLALPA
jgi:ABC-2 type transport system permease protein